MAPKRHLENPPPVSSDEEEELTDFEKSDSVEDEEQPVMETPNGGRRLDLPADSGLDSNREGTPPSPTFSGFTIAPIRSDPAAKPAKKPSSKSGSKRAATENELDGGDLNKKKKKKKKAKEAVTPSTPSIGGDEEETKKGSGAIQRLWSEDDEIAILKGMTEYKAKTGSDPGSDPGAFHDFIKDSVHVEVSKSQLMGKIRRLRRKFHAKAEKSENGEDPVFVRVHDSKAFELSKKIWGKSEANGDAVNNNDTNGSKKKAKQSKSSKNKNNAILEVVNDKPLILGLPRQLASPKKHHEKENVEKSNGAKETLDGKDVAETQDTDGDNGNVEEENTCEESGGKENGGEENGVSVVDFWSQHSYLLDALDTVDSQGLMGRLPKSLLLEKFSARGRDEAKEWDDEWKKLRMEELQLHIKKLNFVTKLSKAALDALK